MTVDRLTALYQEKAVLDGKVEDDNERWSRTRGIRKIRARLKEVVTQIFEIETGVKR